MKRIFLVFILVFSLFSCGKGSRTAGTIFRIVNGADPQSLDPAKIQGVPEHRIMQALFEGLMVYNPEDSKPILGLAQSMPSVSTDGLVYRFKLKEGLVWSDGAPLTAADFEYGYKRLLNPKTGAKYATMLYPIVGAEAYNSGKGSANDVGVRALGDLTLEITLRERTAYFLSLLAHYTYFPHPKHVIEEYGDDWVRPETFVSNGAFKLKRWSQGSKVETIKNDLFYDAANVELDGVTYYTTDDATTAYNMFRKGEVDWNAGIFPSSLIDEVLLREDVVVTPIFGNNHYLFNTQKAPFDDVRVRRAFAMALNVSELTEKVIKDGSVASSTLVPPLPGYPGAKGNSFDPEAAKVLLAEAGYPEGEGFPSVTLLYNTHDTHRVAAEWSQAQWKKYLGLDIFLRNEEWKVFLQNRNNQKFDMARAGWSADYADPMTFLELFLSYSALNNGKYTSEAYDRLVHRGQAMPDGAQRFQVLASAENLLVGQDQALIPFYHYSVVNLIDQNKWDGWYTNILDIHPIKYIRPKQ